MKKYAIVLISLTSVFAMSLVISSCKEDEPPAKPIASFESESLTVSEGSGTVVIEVELDKPAPEDITIEYSLSGTALDLNAAGSIALADYQITENLGEIEIEAGESQGQIELAIFSDNAFEDNEIIIIDLDDAGANAEIGEPSQIEVTISNDDTPAQASMAAATLDVNEDDGVLDGEINFLEVQVNLDKPAAGNTTIKYELSGTAIDSVSGFNQDIPANYYDYYIDGVSGDLTIASGQTSGKIKIGIYTDFLLENTETIIITLVEGGSSSVEIGANKITEIDLHQQDGKAITLSWNNASYTDVDMDLFLRYGDSYEYLLAASNFGSTTVKMERVFVPTILIEGVTESFGLSYVYYSGTADPLNFEVQFADFADGVLEASATQDVFAATYQLDNRNPYEEASGTWPPAIVQTFELENGLYTTFSSITVPETGSRIKQSTGSTLRLVSRIKKETQKYILNYK